MSDERCDLTDLLVDQCACHKHRGGDIIELDDTTGNRVLSGERRSRPFIAAYPGRCVCGAHWRTGDQIMYNGDDELVGTQCCTGDL